MRRIAEKYSTRIHTDAFGGMIHLAYQDKENALLGPDVHLQHCTGLSFDEAMILAKTDTQRQLCAWYGPDREPDAGDRTSESGGDGCYYNGRFHAVIRI